MQLVFESGDYFIQHVRRCGDNSREASDRANTVSNYQRVNIKHTERGMHSWLNNTENIAFLF